MSPLSWQCPYLIKLSLFWFVGPAKTGDGDMSSTLHIIPFQAIFHLIFPALWLCGIVGVSTLFWDVMSASTIIVQRSRKPLVFLYCRCSPTKQTRLEIGRRDSFTNYDCQQPCWVDVVVVAITFHFPSVMRSLFSLASKPSLSEREREESEKLS